MSTKENIRLFIEGVVIKVVFIAGLWIGSTQFPTIPPPPSPIESSQQSTEEINEITSHIQDLNDPDFIDELNEYLRTSPE